MEAQRYPTDYDGILAGAPGNYWTHMVTSSLWIGHASLKHPANYFPPEKYPALHKAVLDACDARDGVNDGVLENPLSCGFDPRVLQCTAGDTATCLTAAQIDTVRHIYGPATNPRTGAKLFPGLQPGSEMGWAQLAGGPEPFSPPVDHFKYVVFKNPDWDYRTLNFDTDIALADQIDGGTINAINPNIGPFLSRGGKLLMYHGWNDPLIPPENSIDYYTSVLKTLGGVERLSSSVRLFMLPGVNHCGGGDGTSTFDGMGALDRWVEQKAPPRQIPASHLTGGKVDRTRPLCPYPQVARYNGTGSTDEAANFTCSVN
jgi:feruloyl esterase